MKISKQARRDAKQLFQSCLVNQRLDEAKVRQVVPLVLDRKPRGYLAILTHFQRLVKLDTERRTARIESADELSADSQASIRQNLEGAYGEGLNIAFSRNESLLGGVKIRVGSDVLDGSVQARLNQLKEGFHSGA